jgi:hypothetical protein
MDLIHSVVIAIALAAPTLVVYFRRLITVASIAGCILAFTSCDSGTRNIAIFSLFFVVVFVIAVDVAEPDEATSKSQQATLDRDGRSFAEVADERDSE